VFQIKRYASFDSTNVLNLIQLSECILNPLMNRRICSKATHFRRDFIIFTSLNLTVLTSIMKLLLTTILALILHPATAQNLVLNPGLDNYNTCPGFGQFSSTYITNWSKPSIASSDYYHFTCPGINPVFQFPRSGEGYAGIIAYNFGQEYREYITGTLSAPLTAGQMYDVEFWVSLHNGYIQAINELGAYLSAAPPGPFSNVLHISVQPQIENTSSALNDTANWRRVWGTFMATGGEQYITIGNFRPDSLTTITQPGTSGSFGAYYFIDDVSVTPLSSTGISSSNSNQQFECWYHNGYLNINISDHVASREILITDLSGRICRRLTVSANNSRHAVDLDTGVYLVHGGGRRVKKVMVD
jgi:hypothetical protein